MLLSALAGLLWPALAGARPAIHSGRHRFVPVTGDWEGTFDGLPASFSLAYKPAYRVYGGLVVPYGFANLIYFEPENCPIDPTMESQSVIGDHDFTPVYAGGSFHLRKNFGVAGGLTGARTAKISIPNSPVPGESCFPKKFVWHLHPVHRRPVQDGTWQATFAGGERETFTVDAGGRLVSLGTPASFTCGAGSLGLFIRPNGRVGAQSPGGIGFTAQFHRRTASGILTGSGSSTTGGSCTLAFNARLVKRSA
jgi:hypothetical protein